jgi:hypothetical protein
VLTCIRSAPNYGPLAEVCVVRRRGYVAGKQGQSGDGGDASRHAIDRLAEGPVHQAGSRADDYTDGVEKRRSEHVAVMPRKPPTAIMPMKESGTSRSARPPIW